MSTIPALFALLLPLAQPAAQQEPAGASLASWEEVQPLVVATTRDGLRFARGELLVGVREGAAEAVVQDAAARGAALAGAVPRLGVVKLVLPDGADEETFAASLTARPDVRYAEPNYLGDGGGLIPGGGSTAPDDTHYGAQWHLEHTGQFGGTPDSDIDAEAAWALESGSPDVVLAVLDTGIDFTHPEFAGRALPGFDFVNEDGDPTADHPHGVWVTGLAAANADNAFQVAGVDHGCSILPVKVLNQFNGGSTLDLAQALDYCAAEGADVVSMSLINYPGSETLKEALKAARQAGCLLVACAGNGGIGNADVSWPGASPLTISIGATTSSDWRAGFSGTGDALDFVAPGSAVRTVDLNPTLDSFDSFGGCSAATPVAAGIVCLLKARDPDLSQLCAYDWLQAGADDLVGHPAEDTPGWDPFMGHGRLNAGASLALQGPCIAPTQLKGDVESIDLAQGGSQVLELNADDSFGGRRYVLLGSLTGTSPGLSLGELELPLVVDAYFLHTLLHPNTVVSPSTGLLDAEGDAVSLFTLPPGSPPSLDGLTAHHAYVVLGQDSVVSAVSAPAAVDLVLAETLLSEDFDSGAAGWTFENTLDGLWHVAPAGECGAPSPSAAYHRGPEACDFDLGGAHVGTLVSPLFQLRGTAPYRLVFRSRLELAPAGLTDVQVSVEVAGGGVVALASTSDFDTSGALEAVELAIPKTLAGADVRLRFRFSHVFGPASARGWSVDDVRVTSFD